MSRELKAPYHVIPIGSGWGIKILTSRRVIEKFDRKDLAVRRAKELMERNNRPMVMGRTRTGNVTTIAVNEDYLENIERLPR